MKTDEKGEAEAKPYFVHGLRRTWYATHKGERYPDAFRNGTPPAGEFSPVQATPAPLFKDAP